MPMSEGRRYRLLRNLDREYQTEWENHRRLTPPNGMIPVGGGHMDPFFRMECLRGLMNGLREGKSVKESKEMGIVSAGEAIRIWNRRREWQVHRSDCWIVGYVDRMIQKGFRG